MSRVRHAPDVRARAMAALLTGDTPSRVAREHGVPLNTAKSWRRRLKRGEIGPFAPQKRNLGGPLLEHLETLLRSLIAQAEHLADPEVLREIPAGELAIIMGTLFDRTMRMLGVSGALIEERKAWPR